jgi:hypothetical protein
MFYGRSHRIVETGLVAPRVEKGQPMFIKIDRIQPINPGRMMSEILADFEADGLHDSVAFDSADTTGESYPFPTSGPICW